ncbi:hypothetical protein [Rhizobium sp.]|uniref:hypothetical protein n=1 Tax=Rhizobium sp. TaxID=391 RepID=UPI0028B0915D
MVSIELAKRVAHVAARSAPLTTLEKLRYSTVMAVAWLSDPAVLSTDTKSSLPDNLALIIEPKPEDFWCWDISLDFVGEHEGIEVVEEHEGYNLYFYTLADLGIKSLGEIVPYLKSEPWAEALRIMADLHDSRISRH